MNVPPLPRPTGGRFFEAYTRGLTTADLERLFTRDAPEAYRFFSRHVDFDELKDRPWHLRMLGRARAAVPGVHAQADAGAPGAVRRALVASLIGLIELLSELPLVPDSAPGLRARNPVAAHGLSAREPAGAARSCRPLVAEE